MPSEKLQYFDLSKHPLGPKIEELSRRVERIEDLLLPIEPLFPLDTAARLLCISKDRLSSFLKRNKHIYLARYMLFGKKHQRKRFLTSDEIRRIRRSLYRGPGVIDL